MSRIADATRASSVRESWSEKSCLFLITIDDSRFYFTLLSVEVLKKPERGLRLVRREASEARWSVALDFSQQAARLKVLLDHRCSRHSLMLSRVMNLTLVAGSGVESKSFWPRA